MSKLSQLRLAWAYTPQAPRCVNCQDYRKPGEFLRDSLLVSSPPLCNAGDFIVGPNGICNKYTSGGSA